MRVLAVGLWAMTTCALASAMTSAPFDVGGLVLGVSGWLVAWIVFAVLSIVMRTAPVALTFIGITLIPFVVVAATVWSKYASQAEADAEADAMLSAYGKFCKGGGASRGPDASTTMPARPRSLLIADFPAGDNRLRLLNWRTVLSQFDDDSCQVIGVSEVQYSYPDSTAGHAPGARILKRTKTCPAGPELSTQVEPDAEVELGLDGPIRSAPGPFTQGIGPSTFEAFTLFLKDRRSGQRLAEETVFHTTGPGSVRMSQICPQIEERLPAMLRTTLPR